MDAILHPGFGSLSFVQFPLALLELPCIIGLDIYGQNHNMSEDNICSSSIALLVNDPSCLRSLNIQVNKYRCILFWNGGDFSDLQVAESLGTRCISLVHLIRENSKVIHDEYISFVEVFAETRYRGVSCIDNLEVGKSISLWWSSLISEKCNYSKSPNIELVARMIALDKLAPLNEIAHLEIKISKGTFAIHQCIYDICRKHGCTYKDFNHPRLKTQKNELYYNICVQLTSIFFYFKGVSWLFRAFKRAFLCSSLHTSSRQSLKLLKHTNTFFTYTAQSSKSTVSSFGLDQCAYWGSLPGTLRDSKINANWVYLYASDSDLPSLGDASLFIASLNKYPQSRQAHLILDCLFDLKMLVESLSLLSNTFLRLFPVGLQDMPSYRDVRLGLLLLDDYISSFSGVTAAKNIYMFILLRQLFSRISPQEKIVYLQENMDWEYILLQIAKANSVSLAVGVPHTTISYWDLRYSYPSMGFIERHGFPLPNVVASNGMLSRRAFLEKNPHLHELLVDVEALRYNREFAISTNSQPRQNAHIKKLSICVMGVSNEKEMKGILYSLSKSILKLQTDFDVELTIKFHPLCNLSSHANNIFVGKVIISKDPIEHLVCRSDVVVCGAQSSVCVDVLISGKKPIVFCPDLGLLVNPLLSQNLAIFVSSVDDFVEKVSSGANLSDVSISEPFFNNSLNTDSPLPLWLKLLRRY